MSLTKPTTLGVKWPKTIVLRPHCGLNEVNGSLIELNRINVLSPAFYIKKHTGLEKESNPQTTA